VAGDLNHLEAAARDHLQRALATDDADATAGGAA
jgi:hypothetical protein